MNALVRRLRALFTPAEKPAAEDLPLISPSAVKRVQPPTLSRRALLGSLPVLAVPWSIARALEAVLPANDSWRYGWIIPETGPIATAMQASVYYGLDMKNPENLLIWMAKGNDLISVTMQQLRENHFMEAAAEIDISQGHRGLALTGGLKMLPGDEDDFDEVDFSKDDGTVMLEGTSERDIEMATQRAARGRDATEGEMSQAENPLYRLMTGLDGEIYVDEMVDIETYEKGEAIIHEGWPMTEDAIRRLKALV